MLEFIIVIIILLFSIIIHEIAHGAAANFLGDPTARDAGRLTLNPMKHLDPIGSIIVPLTMIFISMASNLPAVIIGWAKPVPINPLNFRDKKYGQAKVALAGPGANLAIAVVFGIIIRFFPATNSLFLQNLELIFGYIVWLNLLLAIFNLIPIPPLDGSHILFTFLPRAFDGFKVFLYRYGFIILILFIFLFFSLLIPIISFFYKLIVGIPFIY